MRAYPTYQNVHRCFKLNGLRFTKEDLCHFASFLIKEGEEYQKATAIFLLDWFDSRSYIEMNTSGTTGSPKTIRIDKQAMINSAIATAAFFELKPGDKVLHCLPTQFVAGKMMLVRSLILGLDMDLVPPSSEPLNNNNTVYDFAAMVAVQVQQSLENLNQVKKLIIGGSKVNKTLEKKLQNIPTQIYETYGMTETVTHIAAKKIGEKEFKTLPGVTVNQDQRGCLVINAPNLTEDKVVTNDLVKLISENQFIWLGRIDNVINSGGIKWVPEMIEEKLTGKIKSRFFIAGKSDATLGEKLILIIEGEKYAVEDSVFDQLTKYEKPKEIFFISKFKETVSGKLQRKKTLDLL